MKQLVLGGARSGKSRLAEKWATDSGKDVLYVATAQALDEEMSQRIEQHRARRPFHWRLEEEPVQLADTLLSNDAPDRLILVDCLTLWLSNLLCLDDEAELRLQLDKLLETLPNLQAELILVSNEVGMGIVPLGEMNRRFQDEVGWLHQALAERCDRVIFTVAGLAQVIKGEPL